MAEVDPFPENKSVKKSYSHLIDQQRKSRRFSTYGMGATVKAQAATAVLIPKGTPAERSSSVETFKKLILKETKLQTPYRVEKKEGAFEKLYVTPEGILCTPDTAHTCKFFHGHTYIRAFRQPVGAISGWVIPYSTEELNFTLKFESEALATQFHDECMDRVQKLLELQREGLSPLGQKVENGRVVNALFGEFFATTVKESQNYELL